MREHHGPEHGEFWPALARLLDEVAGDYDNLAAGSYGQAGADFVAGRAGGDIDPAIAVARAYLGEASHAG
jgi:hypothetical protein